jgi:hypothetical protein
MTQKYGVLVKTREDIEAERVERERILQEQYEEERLKRIEMDRIEREKNAQKGMTIQINQGQGNQPQISIIPGQQQQSNTKENLKREELGLKEREENEAMFPSSGSEKATQKRSKRLTIVETPNMAVTNDQKLDENLVSIYNKKRMSYVPVKKVEDDKYQFGTQLINIKVDGETIRGI